MKVTIVNKELNVSAVKVVSISGSSVLLVGDTQTINCSSAYDSITEYIMNAPVTTSEIVSESSFPKKE